MNFTNYEEMAAMILFGIGFTTLLLHKNMIKKIIGFSMMDSAIYLFLAVKGYIAGGKRRLWWTALRPWKPTSTPFRQVWC